MFVLLLYTPQCYQFTLHMWPRSFQCRSAEDRKVNILSPVGKGELRSYPWDWGCPVRNGGLVHWISITWSYHSPIIYHKFNSSSLESEEVFVVIFRCSTLNSAIIAVINFSEIENVELGVDFFRVNWGVYTIFLTSTLILLT